MTRFSDLIFLFAAFAGAALLAVWMIAYQVA
jgi:hypothetical protein